MFFDTIARRRLASLLRPWLREEPELELSVGFVNSRAIAKSLRFDASVLDGLVDDRSGFRFEDVTIEELIIRFSSWSVPAISFEVNGFNVALSVRDSKEESDTRPARKQSETFAECLKKKLAQIDPEGRLLHNILEKISSTTPSGNRFKTDFSNLILKHCRLQIRNLNVQLRFPMLSDSYGCMLRLKELKAESQYLNFGCLFRGIVGSLFLPLKNTSHVISVKGFEIVLKSVDHVDRVLLAADLFSSIKLNDLQLIGFDLRVPKLNVSFSPADLAIGLALGKISSKGSQCTRNGRQLWKLVASRMGHVISSPRLKFHDLVVSVGLWLRYVHAYECLLGVIGYPSDHDILKRNISEMSQNPTVLRSVKQQWKVISDIGQELPPEFIAQARRIARHRAPLNAQSFAFQESCRDTYIKFVCKICRLIYMFFHLIVCLLTFRWKLAKEPAREELGIVSDDPAPEFFFILNLGSILVNISPTNEIQISEVEKLESRIKIPFSGFVSVSLAIDALLLKFVEELCEESLIVSCGQFKVESSSLMETPPNQGSSKNSLSYAKGHRNKDTKSMLWCDAAPIFPLSETTKASTAKNFEGTCDPFLEKLLGEMWLNWRRTCTKLEKSEIQYSENPCLLCESRSFLTYPGPKRLDSGLWKCFFTLGKLHLGLGCSSILSISMLLRQIQDAFRDFGRSKVLSRSPGIVEDPLESSWDSKYKFYANTLSWKLLEMLPAKHIHLGVFIAGPSIKLSLEKEFRGGNMGTSHMAIPDSFHLGLDIKNIELAVWPTSTSEISSDVGSQDCDEAEIECTRLKQPRTIEMPKSDNEKYISDRWIFLGSYFRVHGLCVYLGDSAGKQKDQIFVLQPMAIQLSTSREYFHSFSTNVISLSAALDAAATGLTLLSYMDEFYVLSQMVASLYSAISYLFSSFDSVTTVSSETFRQKFARTESEIEEEIWEKAPSSSSKALFLIEGILNIQSVDLTLKKARTNVETGRSTSSKILAEVDLPDCGILISIQQTSIDMSCEEEKLKIFTRFSEIQSITFGYQNQKGKSIDQSIRGDLLLNSRDYLYEISLSSCRFSLWLFLPQKTSSSRSMHNKLEDSTSGNNTSSRRMDNQLNGCASLRNTSFLDYSVDSEISSSQNSNVAQKLEFSSNTQAPDPSRLLVVDIELGLVYMGSCSLKNALIGAHELNNLTSSLSIGAEFQIISLAIQGGLLFLETKAVEKFICSFASYYHFASNILFGKQTYTKKTEHSADMTILDDRNVIERTLDIPLQDKEKHVQALTINVSQLTTILMIEDEKGGVKELVLEIDVRLNSELANTAKKVIFNLEKLSFLSQVLQESSGIELQIPHFHSLALNNMSTPSGDSASELKHDVMIEPPNDPSSSMDSDSQEKISANNYVPEILEIRHQKHILKHLGALLSVEKHINGQAWVGSGSIKGFDITVSLYEIEMILCIISSLSGIFSMVTTTNLHKKRRLSYQEESGSTMEEMVPDGSIVAIQDVHQHMYFAVDREENKYSLAGAVHYSLVGDRALFRVKYHRKRRWRSSILWFSLTSLHAKNNSGEPFRLNYRSGSGFVDISSTDDGSWSCWRTHSCEPESYESDDDWEPYNQLIRKNFYLVNKKNDCAVAFVDGVPEFVRKPGNPIKFKVFHDLSVPCGSGKIDSHHLENIGTSLQQNESTFNKRNPGRSGKFPCIDIAFDNKKISLTIVHELSDSSDVFPLLRASIDSSQLIVQVLSRKIRVISTSKAAIYHFDSQGNLWRELLDPVEIFIFYRSNFCIQDSAADLNGIPVHFHCRTKELNLSLSELSLDILLFVIGKLNLAGPYLVKSSRILVNCCRVENCTGMNLLCQFNKQRVKIARYQSTSIFLRYSDLANEPLENLSVSLQLAVLGSFTTSLIQLSLLRAAKLAWKTRIISSQGSRTYPGPFIVVDISRESEDGLAISVSPLIRIHNETRFSMELRFRRSHQKEDEFALVMLNSGDTIDDSMAMFDAVHLSGGMKKALTSLSLGNFLFSFRPKNTEGLMNSQSSLSVEWSDDLKGGKAVRLSGIFDKLSYQVRKALLNEAVKCSFSTVQCSLKSEGSHVADMHFLIQIIGRDVPVVQPSNSKEGYEYSSSPVTLQEQKEIFLLPTVKVSNYLRSEIHVFLSETDACSNIGSDNTLNQAMISSGSSVDFYVNPSIIYFTVTLTTYNSSCKSVNSSDWVKKLQKQKSEVRYLDIDLDFDGGSYFACLRLSRGHKGILEATVFTSYALKNDTDFSLYFFAPNRKPPRRREVEKFDSAILPELGLLVPPKSTRSWFLKSNKVCLKLLEDTASEALLDLDALSGLTEISLELEESTGVNSITKLGVSVGPLLGNAVAPSQLVTVVPRYVVINESEVAISVRQCYLQDDTTGTIIIESRQRTMLHLWNVMSKRRELNFFESFIRNHRKANDDALFHIQFQPNEPDLGWSGPVCIASLGRFFLKFRKQQSGEGTSAEKSMPIFAVVHVVEEGSTLVLHYHKPPNVNLPYRIENCLRDVSITYFQKESAEQEVLGTESSVDYVWDDLTLPRRLIVGINDGRAIREINLDKVRGWKPFFKLGQQLAYHFLLDNKSDTKPTDGVEINSMERVKVGYEVYADGSTRVLRICEISKSHKGETVFQSCEKIQLRIPQLTLQLLEQGKRDGNERESSLYTPIIAARFGNFGIDSLFTDQQKYNKLNLQSLIIEPKWVGAPFAALLRRHQVENPESNDCILRIVFVLLSTSSDVIQVKYSSIALQPIGLNLDEETMMKVVPFWRTSLSDPNAKSRQFYFDHFEIHPIKIVTNFLPGESYSSYSSAQETLRSLLHSVIKVPPIKNMVVELNGVLITHALITIRELSIRCAQHYSWYAMRAIYIAKGSPLLPPDFVSMFDDLASSSLDVFFDPSRGLMNLPGFTLGTFKFLSKCIGGKGFSGTKRYFGDLGKSLRTAGSNMLFTAVTEISDSVLKGAEASGFNGMVIGFHQGVMKLAMEPSLLGSALLEGGPDRKIKMDRSPGVDDLYIEGYLQAMLDTLYRQEYLRVRVLDNQVCLKNLPPNNALIEEIIDHVKGFLVSKALLKGNPSRISQPLRHLRGEGEWKLGPTLLTLFEHLFVSFAIRMLRKQANKFVANINCKKDSNDDNQKAIVPSNANNLEEEQKVMFIWRWGIGRFVLSGIVAYVDGRLCRCIPNPIARRIVSGFLLSFLDNKRIDE